MIKNVIKTGEDRVKWLYNKTFGKEPEGTIQLPDSGSNRLYFRLTGAPGTVIGVYNEERKENQAFLSFTRTFRKLSLPVPEILAEDTDQLGYLISDLGDTSLFSHLTELRKAGTGFPYAIVRFYRKALKLLPSIQIRAGTEIDYGKCYPRNAFDRQSMRWDLNYFKYYFLKLARVSFDEQALEEDFDTLTEFLLQAGTGYFMYRDFQSRNIMLLNGEPWLIDYQGGRKGALQYDVASLLYDAKADIPHEVREELLGCYLDELQQYLPGKRTEFMTFFPAFILIRILQAMGAYGYRGYYEKKSHFLQSIPFALRNLRDLRQLWLKNSFGVEVPTLFRIIDTLIDQPHALQPDPVSGIPLPAPGIRHPASGSASLTVTINSFSYKNGIPEDSAGHGGGFVFDCRALPNPGREERFSDLSGLDQPVIDFLAKEGSVTEFLSHVTALVGQSVSEYMGRGFSHLQVSFGCTGGQHRSVYCAEFLRKILERNQYLSVEVNHTSLTYNHT